MIATARPRRAAEPAATVDQHPILAASTPPVSRPRPVYSVVAPVYNEEEILPQFYRRITAVMEGLGQPFELIVLGIIGEYLGRIYDDNTHRYMDDNIAWHMNRWLSYTQERHRSCK